MSQWHAASQIINDTRAAFAQTNKLFSEYGLEDSYADLRAVATAIQTLPPHVAAELDINYRNWVPLAFWNQYKQVYTVHPGLTRELKDTDVNDEIDGQALRHLRHPNPMFVFPGGIPITLTDGKPGRLTAIVVTGAKIGEPGYANFTTTVDPHADGLYLTSIAEVLNVKGKPIDWDYCFTSVPFAQRFTIANLINSARGHTSVMNSRVLRQDLENERTLAYVRRVIGIGIAHILYANARNIDLAEPRQTTSKQSTMRDRVKGPKLKPIKHEPMGYRIGPALDTARRRIEQGEPKASDDGTRTVKPHVRKAHFHTVRYGKGRANSYVDWFPPIPVKTDGTIETPTIHGY